MDVLLTYDITTRHGEVKAALEARGYLDSFVAGNPKVTYNLPNTTLWKQNIIPQTALEEIKTVLATLNQGKMSSSIICLERCLTAEFTAIWAAIPGDARR